MGCDLSKSMSRGYDIVSIHAPTWGATLHCIKQCRFPRSFNPRTHMGCDQPSALRHSAAIVSIHAPTWGATQIHAKINGGEEVSIHAPTWGATARPRRSTFASWFQSTHPHGVRLCSEPCTKTLSSSFNPRTHMGCDTFKYIVMSIIIKFQSTHPHGVRPCPIPSPRCWSDCFNPRTHMGCDR